ncbi:hypothetical protein IV203_030589 [Nitzschia inconspicua]|uniref:BSD domain-containing protein n=1 Tax=Nitzschia inconspicua TaxID=303405 RepID=A0A9K3K5P0_9STRA|nr:hypothetical protein IV203_017604 [Nitzschia inconspicua]KAG7367846.1 hypothetical protein IV203_030589 [Nitzschia inconspicua]
MGQSASSFGNNDSDSSSSSSASLNGTGAGTGTDAADADADAVTDKPSSTSISSSSVVIESSSKVSKTKSFPKRGSSTASFSSFPPLPPIALASTQEWKDTLGKLSDNELQEVILSAPVSEKDIKTMAARIYQHHYDNQNHPETTVNDSSTKPKKSSSQQFPLKGETDFYVTTTSSSSSSQAQQQHVQKQSNSNGNSNTGSYEDDDLTALCFRILRISSTMAKLRFRLVPTKLKEHQFWQALWTILYETVKQTSIQLEESETQTNFPLLPPPSTPKTNNDQPVSRFFLSSPFAIMSSNGTGRSNDRMEPTNDNNDTNEIDREFAEFQKQRAEETIFKLRRTIEKQEWKLQEMQQEIHRLQQQQQLTRGSSPVAVAAAVPPSSPSQDILPVTKGVSSPSKNRSTTTTSLTHHKGNWIMDQDSKDFLEYPVELKENLRMEKRKRLQEVKQQMKFILDSDQVEDTNGHWDCCGQSSYTGQCSQRS